MSNPSIQAEDVVHLKSGGPSMTVESVFVCEGRDSCRCIWFEGKKRHEGVFSVGVLNKGSSPLDEPLMPSIG